MLYTSDPAVTLHEYVLLPTLKTMTYRNDNALDVAQIYRMTPRALAIRHILTCQSSKRKNTKCEMEI